MLSGNMESFDQNDGGATWMFAKTTTDQLATEVGMLLSQEKYKLEKGSPTEAVYGRGNAVLRVLLGAFIARYKFNVSIRDSDGKVMLQLTKGMSGASGGLIGASKMKKETARVIEAIRTNCNA
jgi:hypothetical protein